MSNDQYITRNPKNSIVIQGEKISIRDIKNTPDNKVTNTDIFDKLTELANTIQDNEEILETIKAMKYDVDKPSFTERYNSFIQSAANHMTIFAPIIPTLSGLLVK